jgi:hypothetical protein
MESGTTEYLWSAWGTSGSDVFVVGGQGSILYYDGSSWRFSRPRGRSWNSVTDLEFHRLDKNAIYASTTSQGVYLSPNQGTNWLLLGIPEYDINALSVGSLFAGAQGGLFQLTGTCVIAGKVIQEKTKQAIHNAVIFTDSGINTISVNGEYMMVCPAGIHTVAAVADGQANQSKEDILCYGADVSRVDFPMQSGVSDPSLNIDGTRDSSSSGGSYCFIDSAAF